MASNSFGSIFKITTFGESHGKGVGVVIDGCPAGLEISKEDINQALMRRAPGNSSYTSPRKEKDEAEILSGMFEGRTTGAPIMIFIANNDVDSNQYTQIKDLLRPGHAHYTYVEKYGVFDYKGGGRASARETAARVAAGAIAKKFLEKNEIRVFAYVKQIGQAKIDSKNLLSKNIQKQIYQSSLFCPDSLAEKKMIALLEEVKKEGDSLGGIVEFVALGVPVGLGDPIYEKLEAKLASAMMSLPASKGFEIGSGFNVVDMLGSEHNDTFFMEDDQVKTETNFAGGTLGGISTGMPIIGRVAFKPTSSIMKPQKTLKITKEEAPFQLPQGSRHDPCVAIRAVPIVEAMMSLVLCDALLYDRCVRV